MRKLKLVSGDEFKKQLAECDNPENFVVTEEEAKNWWKEFKQMQNEIN